MIRGSILTPVAWAVLIAIRAGFAVAEHATIYGHGAEVGELLLALAFTSATRGRVSAREAGAEADEGACAIPHGSPHVA